LGVEQPSQAAARRFGLCKPDVAEHLQDVSGNVG